MRKERAAGIALLVLALAVTIVPLLSSSDPLRIGDLMSRRLVPPMTRDELGTLHLLGTDRFGRDLFLRMMLAGRISLFVGIVGSLLSGLLGTTLGALAGWTEGRSDRAMTGAADALLALPRLVLLLVGVALWQPGAATIITILMLTGWMTVARLVRAEVLSVKTRPYVDAALSIGSTNSRALFRHVLPNAIGPAIVSTTLGVGSAILLESGLSFLGLGIQPPMPSWGNMIAGGRDLLVVAPWISLAPGLALVLTVLATTILGDGLRDRLSGDARLSAPESSRFPSAPQ